MKYVAFPVSAAVALLVGVVFHCLRSGSGSGRMVVYRSSIGGQCVVCFTSSAASCRVSCWRTNVDASGLHVVQGWRTERLQ